MIIYLAGYKTYRNIAKKEFPNIAVLESFYDYQNISSINHKIFSHFIFDSGAFAFFNPDKKTNWEEYIDKYCNFINVNNIDLFFEFDIDVIEGLPKVEKYRKKIEQLTNKQPIPVWRPSRGYKYWQKMIAEYPYIAISASGMYDSAWTRAKGSEKILRKMVREAHQGNTKVHGLGYTSITKLPYIGWDSVDSTAWLTGARYGSGIYQFIGNKLLKSKKPDNSRYIDYKPIQLKNFNEWVKYQRYAEKYL